MKLICAEPLLESLAALELATQGGVSAPIVRDVQVGAQMLCVTMQQGQPVLWLLIDPQQPVRSIAFRAVAPGAALPDDCSPADYVGTVVVMNRSLHFFECVLPKPPQAA